MKVAVVVVTNNRRIAVVVWPNELWFARKVLHSSNKGAVLSRSNESAAVVDSLTRPGNSWVAQPNVARRTYVRLSAATPNRRTRPLLRTRRSPNCEMGAWLGLVQQSAGALTERSARFSESNSQNELIAQKCYLTGCIRFNCVSSSLGSDESSLKFHFISRN